MVLVVKNPPTKIWIPFLQAVGSFPTELFAKMAVLLVYDGDVFEADVVHCMVVGTASECVETSVHVTDSCLG